MSYLHPERRRSIAEWVEGLFKAILMWEPMSMQGTEAPPAEHCCVCLVGQRDFRFVGPSSDSLTDCDEQKDPAMAYEILSVLVQMAQCHGSWLRTQLSQHQCEASGLRERPFSSCPGAHMGSILRLAVVYQPLKDSSRRCSLGCSCINLISRKMGLLRDSLRFSWNCQTHSGDFGTPARFGSRSRSSC